jgi:hypothetical protein
VFREKRLLDGQQAGSSFTSKNSTSNRVLVATSAAATHKSGQSHKTPEPLTFSLGYSNYHAAFIKYRSSYSQQARTTVETNLSTRGQSHSSSTFSSSNRGYHNRDYRDRVYVDSDYQGGKQRKRERRLMNREARRTGAPAGQ